MKRVITYGTFDMLHYGHINLLLYYQQMNLTGIQSRKNAILLMKKESRS